MSEEPVFVRSGWGTNRYVYNHRNPVGLALIIIAPLFAIGAMIGLHNGSTWSEGELRDAVHQGVEDLNGARHYASTEGRNGGLIEDAIEESGTGPGLGVNAYRDGDAAGYTISTDDTETKYCVHLTLTPEDPDFIPGLLQSHRTTATLTDGSC